MNGNSTAPRISRLKRTMRKRSSANPIPNTVLAARAAAVNTMEFCSVCRKIELESKWLKLASPIKLPVLPTRASLRLSQTESTNG